MLDQVIVRDDYHQLLVLTQVVCATCNRMVPARYRANTKSSDANNGVATRVKDCPFFALAI